MEKLKKGLGLLAVAVFAGSLFADKIVSFYFDLIWFGSLNYESVFWTVIGAQYMIGGATAILIFLATYLPLNRILSRTSHLPILLSDEIRRDVPLLDFLSSNLRPLFLFGPLLLGIMSGLAFGLQWEKVLLFLNAAPFGESDPIFSKDYSFYLFSYPVALLIKSMLWEILIIVSMGAGLVFFFKRFLFIDANGIVLLPNARRTLSILSGLLFLTLAWDFYLQRYALALHGNGVVDGISYSDFNGKLPLLNILSVISALAGCVCFYNAFRFGFRKVIYSALGVGTIYFAGNFYPTLLQKFVVTPNELIKEAPFIEHTIAGTLKGYGLDKTQVNELAGENSLNAESILRNSATVENIRLWDQEPLLDTLGQIQEIRTYYQFNSIDNDRYSIDGNYRQTLLSPRELLTPSLPNRTWVNEHLTFTHGYGVYLSPVNEVTPEGLPYLFIKDIPPRSEVDLKVERPEIYFGELSSDHVFVNTDTKEFDYPKGATNVYKNYEGKGGFPINSFWRKILLAYRFKTAKIFFSNDIRNDSRTLMYRNIKERVEKVAPFLTLDNDPYLVISKGRLIWLFDAYTISDKFPYSHMLGFLGRTGNYIRNSVKISIDAYDGSIDFYISDPKDPVILTYQKVFPGLFKSLNEMDEDLRRHIRYPSDLFAIQTFIFATYHMKQPQIFYNKEDQWEIPEIDGKMMEPYYTIMKLPQEEGEEYILMLPFTPRGKSNLSAWIVARSDGEHYGKLEAYTFPKRKLIYGPNQIVARINQDAEISRQISLWDQRGSSVIQGTLLVIPIEESLIYIRPLYLKADAGKIPELKRVIVSYEDTIAMEPTLDQAFRKIFPGLSNDAPSPKNDRVQAIAKEPTLSAGEKIVLNREEYESIRTVLEEVLSSQEALEKALTSNRKKLERLGENLKLGRTGASPEAHPEATE